MPYRCDARNQCIVLTTKLLEIAEPRKPLKRRKTVKYTTATQSKSRIMKRSRMGQRFLASKTMGEPPSFQSDAK